MFHFLLMGISAERSASFEWCKDTESVTGKSSFAKAYMAETDVQSVVSADETEKLHYVIVIIERLADAHKHNIGDAYTRIVLCDKHLTEHF